MPATRTFVGKQDRQVCTLKSVKLVGHQDRKPSVPVLGQSARAGKLSIHIPMLSQSASAEKLSMHIPMLGQSASAGKLPVPVPVRGHRWESEKGDCACTCAGS